MGTTVLVTGVARPLGARCAALLSVDPAIERVVGVDTVAPTHDLGRAEFVSEDLRSPAISHVIANHGVDSVVHFGVVATPREAGGRLPQKDINVIGTMQLLAACQRSTRLRRLVVKSSTGVYGASPRDPAVFTEDLPAKVSPDSGWGRDLLEVESYVRAFARRRPDVAVTTLRCANVLGPSVRTSMTEYLALPVVPTVLGRSPRVQFLHEDDCLAATVHAVHADRPGTYNVAGDGVVTLHQALRIAGRPHAPVVSLSAPGVRVALARFGVVELSRDSVRLLTHGRVVDGQRCREELGFTPGYSTRATVAAFAAARCRDGLLSRGNIDRAEEIVRRVVAPGAAS